MRTPWLPVASSDNALFQNFFPAIQPNCADIDLDAVNNRCQLTKLCHGILGYLRFGRHVAPGPAQRFLRPVAIIVRRRDPLLQQVDRLGDAVLDKF